MTSTAGVVGKASSRRNNGSSAHSERPNGRQKPRPKSSKRRSISFPRVSNGRHICGTDDDAVRFSCLIGTLVTVSAMSTPPRFVCLDASVLCNKCPFGPFFIYFYNHYNFPKGQFPES